MDGLPGIPAIFHLVDQAHDGVVVIDAHGRIRYANPAFARLTGFAMAELAGQPLADLLPAGVARHHDSYLARYLEDGRSRVLGQVRAMELRHRSGTVVAVDLKAVDLGMNAGERLFGAFVTARGEASVPAQGNTLSETEQREFRRLQLFRSESADILEQIARDAPLPRVLEAIVRMLECYEPRFVCSIMLLDDEAGCLRPGAAPGLADSYCRAIDGVPVGPGQGSCGTAAFERRLVVVEDIAHDPLWSAYRDIALSYGLRACWSMPILSASGKVLGTTAVYALEPGGPGEADIALHRACCHLASLAIERFHALRTLRESEERFREHASLLDNTQDAILTHTLDGRITFWNRGAERLLGWRREDVVGRSVVDLLFEAQDRERYATTVERLLSHGDTTYDTRVANRQGVAIAVEARKSVVRGSDGAVRAILVAMTDITARKAAEREIYQLAFYDQLTGLPNRRLLADRLYHALAMAERSGQHGAVLMIDLDNFKTINDTLGHAIGDTLLVQAAGRLTAGVRECDTVARLGGDEFIVVLEDLGDQAGVAAAGTEAVARKLTALLSQDYQLEDHAYAGTASIGISMFGSRDVDAEALLREADLAMYRAKGEGRNAVRFFDPQMQVALQHRSRLQADLRDALARDEFELHFQPKVDHDGRPQGVEALLRWQHPRRGPVSPAEFIPVAEETGMMPALGEWVMRRACETLAAWRALPHMEGLTMAVNVSIHQLRRNDFVPFVRQTLEETGADPRRLEIEITESVFADNTEDTVAKMMALKALGIGFSLDDFGTGYSSLSYLKRLPLDQLKIDQSFVRDVLVDANDASIARTIIALAHTLGLEVIAEGVENAAQRDLLLQSGCRAFQGYLFGRPMPEARLRAFMEECLPEAVRAA